MLRALSTIGALAILASAPPARAFTRDSLVFQKCTTCHAAGADGKISAVEEIRTTPEEWTVIVDRMRRVLTGAPASPRSRFRSASRAGAAAR